MKNYIKIYFILFFTISLIVISCKKKDEPEVVTPDPTVEVTVPKIDSITASKTVIQFGGNDPSVLKVYCSGGGTMTYEWEVDLGDLIPQNSDASIITFNSSPCCIGDKEITCTAKNEKGTDSEVIHITILEP